VSGSSRPHLAIENARRSGSAAAEPLVRVGAIGDRLAEGALAIDAQRRVTYANRAASALLGAAIENIVGRDVVALAAVNAGGLFERALREVIDKGGERTLTMSDSEAPPFNVDYCHIAELPDGGALIFLGEVTSPSVPEQLRSALARALAQRAESDTLAQIARDLASAESDPMVALQRLADGAALLLDAEGALVARVDDGTFRVDATSGILTPLLTGDRDCAPALSAEAIAERRWVIANATVDDPRVDQQLVQELGLRQIAVAPLIAEGEVAGVLLAVNCSHAQFTAEDGALLQRLADQGALAIHNGRLLARTSQRAREARALAEIVRHLNESLELDQVVALIATHAAELLGARGARVGTLAGDDLVIVGGAGEARNDAGLRIPLGETFADAAVKTGRPARTSDLRAESSWRESSLTAATGRVNALAVPLLVGERVLGALIVFGNEQRDFTDDDASLLANLGTHAAIAIRNASFLAEAEERAARLAAVAKVQLAISRTELREVYAEIHRAVSTSVLDAPCFALLIADEDAGTFVPQLIVVDGVMTRAQALPPAPLHEGSAGAVFASARALLTANPAQSWADLVPGARRDRAATSEIIAPLTHGDDILGVLIVQSYGARGFTEADVDLVGIIARQAGAAITNARLFESQRSERDLAEVAAAVAGASLGKASTVETAEAVLALLGRVVPAAGMSLAVVKQDENALNYIAATGSTASLRGVRVPITDSVASWAIATREAVICRIRPEQGGIAMDAPLGAGSVIVPLTAGQRVLGLLTATPAGGSTLPASTIETLRRLAAPVSLAIDVQLIGEEERRRRERERMLATALATMEQPVFILSLDRRVRYANEAAVREYGFGLDELTGMSFETLVASAVPARQLGEADATGSPVFLAEHVHLRKDGSQFPASVALSFIREDRGTLVGQVLSVRNLTDERRIAEQLRQSEKLAALGELVAGVAHELNNPLAGISAFAQLMLEESLTEEQFESVRLIKRESDRAVSVIRDLLIFARKSGPTSAPVDINELIRLTLRLRAYSMRTSGVDVATLLDDQLPEVAGDDQKLQQVILNLIVNAEYAMLRSPVKRLTVRTWHEPRGVVIDVADTGTGMIEETLQRIFEPFFTTKPAGEGTGLGLSVSYGIIEAHGGTISVRSTPGKGTTFEVVLPVLPRHPDFEGDSDDA
jgi:two-component system NtrC family sensor kinase